VLGEEIGMRVILGNPLIPAWVRIHVGLDREKEARSLLSGPLYSTL